MKKIFLMMFIVMVFSTPCLANVNSHPLPTFPEPCGLIGIDGTVWDSNELNIWANTIGFSGGKMYLVGSSSSLLENSIVIDLSFIGFFTGEYEAFGNITINGFAFPLLGMGLMVVEYSYYTVKQTYIYPITKIEDDWSPSSN